MAKKVIVYSTATCPFCIRLKDFLSENNVEFTNYDVGNERDKAKEMIVKSGQRGVPVLDIDGKIIVGFNKEAIKEELGIQ
ncbi:MAG: glutaredoxin domain-containing protein [Elusimicrobiota bacterium]